MSIHRLGGHLAAVALAAAVAAFAAPPAWSQTKEVKIGLIAPFSGPWARQGELMKKGAEMAIEDVNNAGGIKALGGAKLKLVTIDAGDKIETAKNAAQRVVAQETDIVGLTGAWLSSFTLAVTEVTERAEVPLLTHSFADKITERGFKYVFQTSPTGGTLATGALPAILDLAKKATGSSVKTVGIIMDNTASSVSFTKPLREGGLEKMGLKLVFDQTFTPPLSDATPLIQKARTARPDFILLLQSNTPDSKLLLDKINEFGLGQGKMPIVGIGAGMAVPELLTSVGKDSMEGVMTIVANWGSKGQEKLIADFKKRTGEPWLGQDSISTYGDIWIFKEALEKAGVADKKKVADAIRAIDTTTGPANFYAGGKLKFDERGRRTGAALMIVQWQKGEPVTIYPPEAALAKPNWPKR